MRDLKIAEVHEIAFATSQSLKGDEIGKRADRGLDAINPANFRSHQQLLKAERWRSLGENVEVSVRRREIDRPSR